MPEQTQPQRAVIEYKETPLEGKPIKFKTVIESAKDANDARVQFWATQIWPAARTQGVNITAIEWPDAKELIVDGE
ncbi:MAG TPA: hypothetical protein VFX97_17060 [Pyrinomonadaceae bacterium]|nr:hypothetical protein [Pyrinomonadaceae bacterium]